MRQQRFTRLLALGIALAVATGPGIALAEEGIQGNGEEISFVEQGASDEGEGAASDAPVAEGEHQTLKGLEGDSFRFHNGAPVEGGYGDASEYGDDELVAMADAWKKNSAGQYISSNGSVIQGALRRGVDVSEWQDTIDWAKAKADDISFAVIRCGGTFYRSRAQYSDGQFERNASELQRLGIPYGVYFFSTAYTVEDAIKEADFTIAQLRGKNVSLPVYYDLEYEDAAARVSPAQWGQIAKAFCDRIAAAGYTPGVYASVYWWEHYLTDPVFDNWTRWVAQYYSRCQYEGSYDMWQCSSDAPVAGIAGGVDLNMDFGIQEGDIPTNVWHRVWGDTKLDTMAAIVREGWSSSHDVVISTTNGYWDALSANSLAGSLGAPVLLTDKDGLDAVTASEIQRLGARKAYVIGGPLALSDAVVSQLRDAGVQDIERIWGDDAEATACKVAEKLGNNHSDTCFVATADGFQDALSASPLSYAKRMPVFLTHRSNKLLNQTALDAIKAGGYKKVVIVGGTVAVPAEVEDQLKGIGIPAGNISRKWGEHAIQTSSAIAAYGLELGLGANKMGVATSGKYYDALAGSALCGKNNAVLVLASDSDLTAFNDFVRPQSGSLGTGYVFGGYLAVSHSSFNALARITG